MQLQEIDIDKIFPHHTRPVDPVVVKDLVASIRRDGLLAPLVVVKRAFGKYRLVSGHHRYAALKLAGIKMAACQVVSKKDAARIEPIENLLRTELTALDAARAKVRFVKAMLEQREGRTRTALKPGEITRAAQYLPGGRNPEAKRKELSRALRIASIPKPVRKAIRKEGVADDVGQLLKIAAEKGKQAQLRVLQDDGAKPLRGMKNAQASVGSYQAMLDGWRASRLLRAAWRAALPKQRRKFIENVLEPGTTPEAKIK